MVNFVFFIGVVSSEIRKETFQSGSILHSFDFVEDGHFGNKFPYRNDLKVSTFSESLLEGVQPGVSIVVFGQIKADFETGERGFRVFLHVRASHIEVLEVDLPRKATRG